MNNNCCSSEDIFRLNNSKEYVLLSQRILELVVTDPNLHAQAAKLWQFLYSKAKFDKQLAVTVSYSVLANTLGKSTRTIARYIANLVEQGYLALDANFANSGSRLANTLFVRIPTIALENITASKNRKESYEKKTKMSHAFNSIPADETVSIPSDSSDITINNINKNNNNNMNVVVDFSRKNSEQKKVFHVEQSHVQQSKESQESNVSPELQKQIDRLEEQCQQINEQFKNSSHENRCLLLPKLTRLEGEKQALQLFCQQQKRMQSIDTGKNQQHILNQDEKYMLKKCGERPFNPFEIHRLKQGLQPLCKIEQLPRLLNEITYAIRFQELRSQQTSGKALSIHHAISIALKLVREGRWETPKGITEFMTKFQ